MNKNIAYVGAAALALILFGKSASASPGKAVPGVDVLPTISKGTVTPAQGSAPVYAYPGAPPVMPQPYMLPAGVTPNTSGQVQVRNKYTGMIVSTDIGNLPNMVAAGWQPIAEYNPASAPVDPFTGQQISYEG